MDTPPIELVRGSRPNESANLNLQATHSHAQLTSEGRVFCHARVWCSGPQWTIPATQVADIRVASSKVAVPAASGNGKAFANKFPSGTLTLNNLRSSGNCYHTGLGASVGV